jgi:hypothetical protein
MLMIALPKMKFITPVNMDKANRTGSKIIFNISAVSFLLAAWGYDQPSRITTGALPVSFCD